MRRIRRPPQQDDWALLESAVSARANIIDDLYRSLHPRQRVWVADKCKRKAALCGRRGGKSHGAAVWLTEGAELGGHGMSLYVALRRNNARAIMWSAGLERISQRFNLGYQLRELDGQLMVLCPNGHRIWLAGCTNEGEIEKFRGFAFHRVLIDECASLGGYLGELVEDVLDPTLLDQQGEMALIGSPGAALTGYFYEATQDAAPNGVTQSGEWSVHHWTVLDNPFIPHAADWLAKRRERRGWSEDHPTYLREWLGRWARDDGALIYPYDASKNRYEQLPVDTSWEYGIGIDLGYEDSTAWVVVAMRRGHPELYVLSVDVRQHLIPSAVAAYTERLLEEYPNALIVADEGGFGKGYAAEMRERHGLPVEPAKKQEKRAAQEVLAGELRNGMVKIHPSCRDLLNEMAVLQWGEGGKEDARFPNHACDALLYITRAMRPLYRPEYDPPSVGSREWWARESERERREARLAGQRKKPLKINPLRAPTRHRNTA